MNQLVDDLVGQIDIAEQYVNNEEEDFYCRDDWKHKFVEAMYSEIDVVASVITNFRRIVKAKNFAQLVEEGS